jgi:hypothetical protein
MYGANVMAVAPTFLIAYFVLLGAQAVFLLDMPAGIRDLLGLLIAIALPFVIGSVLFAVTSVVAVEEETVGSALSRLRALKRDLLAAGLLVAVIASFFAYFAADFALILEAVILGPPLVIQTIALERLHLRDAWPRTKQLAQRKWGQAISYLMMVVLGVGVIGSLALSLVGSMLLNASDATITAVFLPLQALTKALAYPFVAMVQVALWLNFKEESEAGEDSR